MTTNTKCTCTPNTIVFDSALTGERVVGPTTITGDLCDYCTMMLWAAELEQRMSEAVTGDDVERMVEEALRMSEAVTGDDVERMIEEAVEDKADKDEVVTEDDVERLMKDADFVQEDDLEEHIKNALDDSDIIEKVAAGAARAAMKVVAGEQRLLTQRQEAFTAALDAFVKALAALQTPPVQG